MKRTRPDNDEIADLLERLADLLETQDGNIYRVRAYRNAARTARSAAWPLAGVVREGGRAALEKLPGIGKSIALLLDTFVHSGRSAMLDRLEGQVSPEDLFTTVPGIGEKLARRIHHELGIDTLEELELASHDERLDAIAGIGPRRVRGIRDAVGGILTRGARRRAHCRQSPDAVRSRAALETQPRPGVVILLHVDREYRERAALGLLRQICPRRFNPERRSWLPVLHTERDGWSFSVLFSNTARAHELGTTNDWVIVYYERDGEEGQCTVVTERGGPLTGRRMVRGRESECAELYGVAAKIRSTPVP